MTKRATPTMLAHHIAILTPNLAALELFYSQMLGLPVVRRWDDAGIVFLDAGGLLIELTALDHERDHGRPHQLDRGAGMNHLAFEVAQLDIKFDELVRAGVQVVAEPQQYRNLRIAFLADPDGNVLELVEHDQSGITP